MTTESQIQIDTIDREELHVPIVGTARLPFGPV
jgi:hypothetical protein